MELFALGIFADFYDIQYESRCTHRTPEDEASLRNSLTFPPPCPFTAMQLNSSRAGTAKEWPDGRPLWSQSMMVKWGTARSPAASLPPWVHWDRNEAQTSHRAWEMLLRATLWETVLNHQLVCTAPPAAGCLVVIARPQAPVIKVILHSLNNCTSCLLEY